MSFIIAGTFSVLTTVASYGKFLSRVFVIIKVLTKTLCNKVLKGPTSVIFPCINSYKRTFIISLFPHCNLINFSALNCLVHILHNFFYKLANLRLGTLVKCYSFFRANKRPSFFKLGFQNFIHWFRFFAAPVLKCMSCHKAQSFMSCKDVELCNPNLEVRADNSYEFENAKWVQK